MHPFLPKIEFFLLFAKSVNLDLQIAGKCISDTIFDLKAHVCCPLLINTIFPKNITV